MSRKFVLFRNLLGASSVLAFFVIALGAIVRITHSGIACPDWPLCFNELIPNFNVQIFLEWFHRLLAGSLTILVLIASFIALRESALRQAYMPALYAGAVLLGLQVILGGLTVLKLLNPRVVSAHLITGILFFSLLVWLFELVRRDVSLFPTWKTPPILSRIYGILAIGILAQIFLGGMVSTNHAGLVCPDFPTCNGSWFPTPAPFLIIVQMAHRYLAFFLAALSIIAGVLTYACHVPPATRLASRLLPLLVMVQIFLGIANVSLRLPIQSTVPHFIVAITMYTLALRATIELRLDGQSFPKTLRNQSERSAPSERVGVLS